MPVTKPSFYLESNSTSLGYDARSKALIVAVDKGAGVAVLVDHAEVDRVTARIVVRPRVASCCRRHRPVNVVNFAVVLESTHLHSVYDSQQL